MHADPPTEPYRDCFHDSLERLETDVQAQGARVRSAPSPEPRAGW
jgi:hypothetical protein